MHDLILSTKKGLWFYDSKTRRFERFARGRFFGLTYDDEYLYAAEDPRDIKFLPKHDRPKCCARGRGCEHEASLIRKYDRSLALVGTLPIVEPLFKVHQILLIEGILWICNTRRNQIVVVDPKTGQTLQTLDHFGTTENGREDAAYVHVNSLWHDGEQLIYLVAHNQYSPSFYASFNPEQPQLIISRKEEIGRSCHNIAGFGEDLFWCDSAANAIRKNDQVWFETDRFLRGLALSDRCLVTAGSSINLQLKKRFSGDGTVYFVPWHGETSVQTIPDSGDVHDLRIVNQPDQAHGGPAFLIDS